MVTEQSPTTLPIIPKKAEAPATEAPPSDLLLQSAGYVQVFPAPGLRRTVRYITGLNEEGKAVFLSTDCGDHHRIIGNEQAIANILYSTNDTPAELNGNVDLKYAKENEVMPPHS